MIGRRRESGSAWYGQLVGSIAAGLSKRPKITVETLILLVALYFLMATNAAFWNALAATGVLEGSRGWSIVAALAVAGAEKIVGRSVDQSANNDIIDKLVAEL